jgi:hypothetical protein
LANSSFEYPSSYIVTDIDKGSYTESANVYFNSIRNKTTNGLIARIYVTVRKTNDVFPNYLSFLEFSLGIAQQGQSNDEFNIVERSIITIDNIQGEKVIYHYIVHNPDKYEINDNEIMISESIPAIAYEVYVEKDGFIWTIEINSLLGESAQAKADFQHIIKSFKFLDRLPE